MKNEPLNRAQFEDLFRTHYAPLVGYAIKMLEDADAAADVVQNLFVNVWEKRDEIVVESSVKSYLLRSTHNLCLNQIKHLGVRKEHKEHTMAMTSESEQRDLLEELEFKQLVAKSIKNLPKQCRKIFLMSRVQGKKYQLIADELSISVKTVENQMGKALKTLREDLRHKESRQLRVVKTLFWFLIGVKQISVVIN